MPDDENAVQIYLAFQGMSCSVIPGSKLFEVFEVNDRSAVVLSEVGSVEEVYVDCCRDDSVRREQLTQIQVSRSGIHERIVIAVRKYGERKRASTPRHANMSIDRHLGVGKWPGRSKPEVREG
jgi:hypothetical protein